MPRKSQLIAQIKCFALHGLVQTRVSTAYRASIKFPFREDLTFTVECVWKPRFSVPKSLFQEYSSMPLLLSWLVWKNKQLCDWRISSELGRDWPAAKRAELQPATLTSFLEGGDGGRWTQMDLQPSWTGQKRNKEREWGGREEVRWQS